MSHRSEILGQNECKSFQWKKFDILICSHILKFNKLDSVQLYLLFHLLCYLDVSRFRNPESGLWAKCFTLQEETFGRTRLVCVCVCVWGIVVYGVFNLIHFTGQIWLKGFTMKDDWLLWSWLCNMLMTCQTCHVLPVKTSASSLPVGSSVHTYSCLSPALLMNCGEAALLCCVFTRLYFQSRSFPVRDVCLIGGRIGCFLLIFLKTDEWGQEPRRSSSWFRFRIVFQATVLALTLGFVFLPNEVLILAHFFPQR